MTADITEIKLKFTYECESFFFDYIWIEVWIVVSNRVPKNFLRVVSGPAESYQPINGLFVQVSIEFGLLKFLFKELFIE